MRPCINLALDILTAEEGYSGNIYRDTEGYLTVGYGLKISSKDEQEGYFRSFPFMPYTVAEAWLKHLVKELDDDLTGMMPSWDDHSPLRQAVIISMAYQLGLSGLEKFVMTLNSFKQRDYTNTSIHMLDSLWARQTPRRAERHAKMMETNELCQYYLL